MLRQSGLLPPSLSPSVSPRCLPPLLHSLCACPPHFLPTCRGLFGHFRFCSFCNFLVSCTQFEYFTSIFLPRLSHKFCAEQKPLTAPLVQFICLTIGSQQSLLPPPPPLSSTQSAFPCSLSDPFSKPSLELRLKTKASCQLDCVCNFIK